MKAKKFVSMALALVMVMALMIPAFAEDETPWDGSIAYTANTKSFTVDVTVSGAASNVTFNPYKMQVSVDGEYVTEQIISPAVYLTNKTPIKLAVSATAKATVPDAVTTGENQRAKSGISFATKPLTAADTGKVAFVYWEIMSASEVGTEPTWTKYDDTLKASFNDLVGTDTTKKAAAETALKSFIVLSKTAPAAKEVMTLNAVGPEDDPNYAAFHLTGEAVVNPVSSSGKADNWLASDDFSAVVTLTFAAATT